VVRVKGTQKGQSLVEAHRVDRLDRQPGGPSALAPSPISREYLPSDRSAGRSIAIEWRTAGRGRAGGQAQVHPLARRTTVRSAWASVRVAARGSLTWEMSTSIDSIFTRSSGFCTR